MRVEKAQWAQDRDTIHGIRHQVFVLEQHVSPQEEWDGFDEIETTEHFLVYESDANTGRPIATARLLRSGKLGRMAVLDSHRNQGVGASLLKYILTTALRNQLDTIFLHAQVHAVPFYEKYGFSCFGEEFVEAEIPHRKMRIRLRSDKLFEVLYRDQVLRLDNIAGFQIHLQQITLVASTNLDILSHHLDKPLYAASPFVQAVSRLARRSPNSQVRILLRDSKPLQGSSHPLVLLAQRLPSRITLRTLQEATQNPETAYVISDRRRLVYFNSEADMVGFANYQAAAESQHQLDEFEHLWHSYSVADPNLARLNL